MDFCDAAVSAACSYCGSQLVDAERAALAFDRVAPFRLPKRAAEDKLREHLHTSYWAPEEIRKGARQGRVRAHNLRGALVPFYVYSANVRGSYGARIGVDWYRTKEKRDKEGKKRVEVIRETEWFDLRGTFVDALDDHLVEASVGLSEKEAGALQPFDLGRANGYDARLLSGWEAEVPSRPRAEVDADAHDRLHALAKQRLQSRGLPGDHRRIRRFSAEVSLTTSELTLLPVWIASYRYHGRVWRLLVNGQTGRCVGRAPISSAKVSVAIALAAALVVLALWLGGVFG